MASGSAKGSKKEKTEIEEMMQQARATSRKETVSGKEKTQADDSAAAKKFSKIAENPFYKIMFDPNSSPEAKMEAVAKVLEFADNKDKAKEELEAFKMFKEYLQFERKRMAQQIIELTDTEAFSELKQVYDELNNALVAFEDKISPLTEIVDSVYKLRMNGLTFDVFREIALDREEEARLAALLEQQKKNLLSLEEEMRQKQVRIAHLGEDKSFFGFGPVKESARKKIAELELRLDDDRGSLSDLTQKIEETAKAQPRASELNPEFLEAKGKLRELLDISSNEHKQRQEDLVQAAQNFVNTTEERVSSISEHFVGMDKQIENLLEANYSMREIYAILNDATKNAHQNNEKYREELVAKETAEESDIAKMNRERDKRDLENYIGALNASSYDTTTVLAELTNASHRIKSMKDGNQSQIDKTRQIHSSGVAGVADQLSTVLQAVSAAALGESSEMARMSLERMNTKTQDLSQKEVIRLALGTHEQNNELSKALEGLEQYGEVIRTATTITREGLKETKDLLGRLEDAAKNVQEDVKESISVAADVVAGKGGVSSSSSDEGGDDDGASDGAPPNPFKI
ncbi:MAG: hypothetical protein KDI90_00195 [Alphaproteobacteria bacterium]|nr:hypothetical protein [Alphaproteobacteria bacterium]MCB9974691.1 hypothetical protein [Rhodospirillales bacterium]